MLSLIQNIRQPERADEFSNPMLKIPGFQDGGFLFKREVRRHRKCLYLFCFLTPSGLMGDVSLAGVTHLGQCGVSVNAVVKTGGAPGRYWLVYGQPGEMQNRTVAQPLPPVLGAYYEESWDQDTAGWKGGLSGNDLLHVQELQNEGFVRYMGPTEHENSAFPGEPPGLDVNHIDGIGELHLCQYIYSAKLGANPLNSSHDLGLNLGGGLPDLRDARVTVRVRGNSVSPRGAELTFWAQSDHRPELQLTPKWVRANWAFTGSYVTHALLDGNWNEVSYVLINNTRHWTYGGNNWAQERPDRYAYLNLDQSLRNLNANFFHLYIYVDGKRPPEGTIDFDSLKLKYRNHSLLFPAHGASLLRAPQNTDCSPEYLTDGWRKGNKREWHSGRLPSTPQTFIWKLPEPARLEKLQIHQSVKYPSREVVAYASPNGLQWQKLVEFELPQSSSVSANHAYVIRDVNARHVTHFKLEILSGYEEAHWGLGEVELFGDGIPLATDPDGASVNIDLEQLSPGETYSYQFIVETADGEIQSPVGYWQVPADDRPVVVAMWRQTNERGSSQSFWARIAPMGNRTTAHLEVLLEGQWRRASMDHYVGNQITERDVRFTLDDTYAKDAASIRIVMEYGATKMVYGEPHEVIHLPLKNL